MLEFKFARIPPVHFGPGKIDVLPKIARDYGSNALLITGGSSLRATGVLDKICRELRRSRLSIHHHIIHREPRPAEIDEICNRLRGTPVDVVIAVGGGSVIDGGKAVSAMLPHGNSVFDHLEGLGKSIPHSGVKKPFIAVPTTAGTGSEMTKNAVLSMVGETGYKKSIRHESFIPDAVIEDPILMANCPPEITAACGMDAFSQLLESYTSTKANPLTDSLALSGMEKILNYLGPACAEGATEPWIRAEIAYGAMLSGITLANAGLGIVHGLAGPMGGFFEIPHGVVCGLLLLPAVKANIKALRSKEAHHPFLEKYARVGALLFPGADTHTGCTVLMEKLENWSESLPLPRLGKYGITESDLDKISEAAKNRNNPVALTREEIYHIVKSRL